LKLIVSFLLCLLLTGLLLTLGLYIGSFETSFSTIWRAVFYFDAADTAQYAIIYLRLPRILLAFLVGGALALSGYLLQAMVNNPLADPYILGTASGAALGANVVFLGWIPLTIAGIYMPAALAFAVALLVTFIVISLAYKRGQIIPSQLLLGGVAVSSLLTAGMSLLTFLSDSEGKLRTIIFWSLGSFERAQWTDIPFLTGIVLAAMVVFTLLYRHITLIILGEHRAYHLGLQVSRLRWIILIGTAIVTGAAVAASGAIGFVGLMVPHLVRGIYGVSNRYNPLLTVWIGGLFVMGCDLLARLVYPPAGVPVGIITSFLGVPFFLYLLLKKDYRFD
jgi:iron complex transport system permease protein